MANAIGTLTSIEVIQKAIVDFTTGKDTEHSFAVACLFHEAAEFMRGKTLPEALK